MGPLEGIRVLDFSTLLPGPLATLLLAEAGAEVIKIERPGRGDEMRSYTPKFGADSVNFALLNRGKRSIAIDLKDKAAVEKLKPLIESADVVVEQFRPGVMDRLGLGYDGARAKSIRASSIARSPATASTGPRADVAAHDLNYIAEAGLLALAAGADGAPVPPPALIADIGGGTYPAVINILLALRERDRTGKGCKLDIAMADNLFAFMYWAMGNGEVAGEWPTPGGDLVTGGSPRYNVYRTQGRQVRRRGTARAEVLGKFLRAARACARCAGRQPRCRENPARGRGKDRRQNRRRMARAVCGQGRLLLHHGVARRRHARSAFHCARRVRRQARRGRKRDDRVAGARRTAIPRAAGIRRLPRARRSQFTAR